MRLRRQDGCGRSKLHHMLLRAGILAVLVVGLVGYLFYSHHRHEPLKVSGFVEADEIRVGSRVGGRVSNTLAVEGATGHKGDLRVELEPYDLLARQAQTKAQLESAGASVELAKITYDRMKSSYESKATSASELDRASADLKSAVANENIRKD